MTHSSPSSVARVWMFARSLPGVGLGEALAPHLLDASGSSAGSAASAPRCRTGSASGRRAPRRRTRAASARSARVYSSLKMICSATLASRPPYSFGQVSPTQRSAPSSFSHSTRSVPAGLVARPVPRPERGELAFQVLAQPGAHLRSEGRFRGRVDEVHGGPTLLDRPVMFPGQDRNRGTRAAGGAALASIPWPTHA